MLQSDISIVIHFRGCRVSSCQAARLPWRHDACYGGVPDIIGAVQGKISADATLSKLRQRQEQTRASNAALQQERVKSAAQQQELEALRNEMAMQQVQPAPLTMSLPAGSSGVVHGASVAWMIGASVLRSQLHCLGHCVSSRRSDRSADAIHLLCAGRAGSSPGPAPQQPGGSICSQDTVGGDTAAAAGEPAQERAGAPPPIALLTLWLMTMHLMGEHRLSCIHAAVRHQHFDSCKGLQSFKLLGCLGDIMHAMADCLTSMRRRRRRSAQRAR